MSNMVANIRGKTSVDHNELEEAVGSILILGIGFLQQMPEDMDVEMYKLRLGEGCHVEPQSSPLFDGARGQKGDIAAIRQIFCSGEFLPGHYDVNSMMGNLSMSLDRQYFGPPVNRFMPMRRELSPCDQIKNDNFKEVSRLLVYVCDYF